jgi:hypothetical protein
MSEIDNRQDREDELPDARVKRLIAQWPTPEPSDQIKKNIMAAYQDRMRQRDGQRGLSWWQRVWMIRMPLPATALIIIIISIALLPLLRSAEIAPVVLSPPVANVAPVQVVEVPVIKEKVITEKIYIKSNNSARPAPSSGLRGIDGLDPAEHSHNKIVSSQQNSNDHDPSTPNIDANGARDFTLEDVMLNISNFKLTVNGELLASADQVGDRRAGSLLWFYLPERGRFIISLAPRPGYPFQKLGCIDENSIKFSWQRDNFELISDKPIVGAGGKWRIWIACDPTYRPDFDFADAARRLSAEQRAELKAKNGLASDLELEQFLKRKNYLIGATDSAEFLFKK